jgi:hypothetical protein
MAEDKDNDAALKAHGDKGGNISGQQPSGQNGPVAGSAENTRGENKPSREGTSGGAKHGKDTPDQDSPQGSNANSTTTRGSDSTDKEFRNNQPNASTLKEDMKNSSGASQDQG